MLHASGDALGEDAVVQDDDRALAAQLQVDALDARCMEVVVLLGTAACDEDCAMLMCKSEIVTALIELLKG